MCYSFITTLVISVYKEKKFVFADSSIPNTSISKFIDLIWPVNEWADIAFSGLKKVEI